MGHVDNAVMLDNTYSMWELDEERCPVGRKEALS